MLGEVRTIVSTWRSEARLDVAAALRHMAGELRTPSIVVDVRDDLDIADPPVARALIRCAQEIVTNAVRHASAQHVWLDLGLAGDGLLLVGRDDGCGRDAITLG